MGLTALWRAVNTIAGTIAGLPLKTFALNDDDSRRQIVSYLDNPGVMAGMTSFELKEFIAVSLLLHGNAYLLPRENGAGLVAGLLPVAPAAVVVDCDNSGIIAYRITMRSGAQQVLPPEQVVHIRALSTDGIMGLSPIAAARQSIGTALASDKVAARFFGNGMLLSGIVTPKGDIPEEEAKLLGDKFRELATGHENSAEVRFVNRDLAFTPYQMSADDAQFLESRAFSVSEIARLYGVPKQLLMEDGASTWGTGVTALVEFYQRFTLMPWTTRIQERLAQTLSPGVWCEFDYGGLLQGSPQEVTANLAAEIAAGIRTPNEARKILNLPPLPEGAIA